MAPPGFNQRNAKAAQITTQQVAMPQPWHSRLLKREHADDEVIDAKSFPFDELIPHWKGDDFNPNFKNAATAVVLAKTHQVKGEHERTKNSFKDFVFAFCLQPVKHNGVWDRCFNSFTVKSPGCCFHPKLLYKDGPNLVCTLMIQGKPATWGMLKFNEPDQEPKPVSERELRKVAQQEARAEEEAAYDVPGQSGDGIYVLRMAQFEEWLKIQKQYKREYEAAGNSEYVLGSTVAPPDFMSLVNPIPSIGALTVSTRGQEQQIINGRKKQGKKAGEGRPGLDFKSLQNPNAKRVKKTQGRLPTIIQGAVGGTRDDMAKGNKKNLAY